MRFWGNAEEGIPGLVAFIVPGTIQTAMARHSSSLMIPREVETFRDAEKGVVTKKSAERMRKSGRQMKNAGGREQRNGPTQHSLHTTYEQNSNIHTRFWYQSSCCVAQSSWLCHFPMRKFTPMPALQRRQPSVS